MIHKYSWAARNYIKTAVASFCIVATLTLHSMNIDFGFILTGQHSVSTFKYIHKGKIQCLDSIVDVRSFTGNGTITAGNTVSITCSSYFGYAGKISAGTECVIKAKTFDGCSVIRGSTITLICDEFTFTGTVSCDGKCTIYTRKPIDASSFKREGKGTFEVVIAPLGIEFMGESELFSRSYKNFHDNCLRLDETAVDSIIRKIRNDAAVNKLDENALLEKVKKDLKIRAQFHKDHLTERRDQSSLSLGLTMCGISAIGLACSYALFKNKGISQKFGIDAFAVKSVAVTAGIISAIPAFVAPGTFYDWLYPRHKEKYEALSLIIRSIENALAAPQVCDVKVVRLP